MTAPRMFVSYSWTSPEHEKWVVDLASELVTNGVEVLLDKWDLREGHDAIAFMERMVNDPEVKKVILVCDKAYATKTNARKGGVGTEAQIISPEIYAKQDQNKFVAVVAEVDDDGKPYLPTYYKSRIYIDLSQDEKYSENFEQLLRWIFDKPLYVKPQVGKPPSYITEPESVVRATAAAAKRAVDALKSSKAHASGALEEYLTRFVEDMEKYCIRKWDGERDDLIARSIDEFLPARNEFVSVLLTLIQYGNANEYVKTLHRFLEALLPFMDRPADATQWNETDYDNFRFIVHEIFLIAIAALLRAERFEAARYLLATPYYVVGGSGSGVGTFTVFREFMSSFEARSKRLRRISVRADLLKNRADPALPFRYLMQADFVCFLRAGMLGDKWWPESLLHTTYGTHGAFDIFARAVSREYAAAVFNLLGIKGGNQIAELLESAKKGLITLPRWDFDWLNVEELSGLKNLGTRP